MEQLDRFAPLESPLPAVEAAPTRKHCRLPRPRSGNQQNPLHPADVRRPNERRMSATAEYRYPGIQPFSGRQKNLFFGRDNDRERLLSLLLLEKLTVLFGKSGYGKSSLLNAGIAPGLEKESRRGKREYVPVFVRFHSRVGNEQYDWFDWFAFQLAQQAPINPDLYEPRSSLPRTLWGELKRRQTGPRNGHRGFPVANTGTKRGTPRDPRRSR
jgi:hypothetical protein